MSGDSRMKIRFGLGTGVVALLIAATFAGPAAEPAKPLKAGQESLGPWWMRQTALAPNGKFASLKTKHWWKKAQALKPGESMVLDVGGEAKDRMLVRRETVTFRDGKQVDTIVWVIDDDGNGSALTGGDRSSDCYIVDYGADGIVDRIVDYIDNNGDGVADEMDIRFFEDGVLNYAWFGEVVQGQAVLFDIKAFDESLEDCRAGGPDGDKVFYINKFNPDQGIWAPLGECPLAYFSETADDLKGAAVRISVVPVGWDPVRDPDFASGAYARPWDAGMTHAAVAGVRTSYDVDRRIGGEKTLHYGMSFNLVGRLAYEFPGMVHFNALRRPPQETVVISWKDIKAVADSFESRETGFSWVENVDTATGDNPTGGVKSAAQRKGIPWVWERRPMDNSGGPSQKWNVRREWSGKPSSKRELYYSGIDKRVHLFGAEEGWIQVGNFAGLGPVGEIRMFDTDKDGYFDRWEVCLANSTRPVRVTQVSDEKAKRLDVDPGSLPDIYAKEILPKAKSDNEKLLAALNALHTYDAPPGLRAALTQGPESYKIYAQDILRELSYISFRDYFSTLANQTLLRDSEDQPQGEFWGDLSGHNKRRKVEAEPKMNSAAAWKLIKLLDDLDMAYGRAEYDRAAGLIAEIGKLQAGK